MRINKTLYNYWRDESLVPIYAGKNANKLCLVYNKGTERGYSCHPICVEQVGEATINFSFDTSIRTEITEPEETISYLLCNCKACLKSRRALVAWGYKNKDIILSYNDELGEVVAYLRNDKNKNWFFFSYKSFKTVKDLRRHYTDDEIIDIVFDQIEVKDDDERVYIYGCLYESHEESMGMGFKYIGLFTSGDQNAIIYKIDGVLQAWVTPDNLSSCSEEQVIEYLNDTDNDEKGWSVTADSMGELMEQLM